MTFSDILSTYASFFSIEFTFHECQFAEMTFDNKKSSLNHHAVLHACVYVYVNVMANTSLMQFFYLQFLDIYTIWKCAGIFYLL